MEAGLPFAVVGYLLVGFAWPTLRARRRHGTWPVVFHRRAAPGQRLFGLLTPLLLGGLVALAAARWVRGPEVLGAWPAPGSVRAAGWILLAVGALITVVGQHTMGASWRVGIDDRPTDLVTHGIFRIVRNPVFAGLLTFLAGFACLSPAWWSLAILAATTIGVRIQIAHEERHLVALHGETYRTYASRIGRLVPFLGRLRAPPCAPGRHGVRRDA
jgi:protein-S-isoprenylcysteine O-methyltransferase Ste14